MRGVARDKEKVLISQEVRKTSEVDYPMKEDTETNTTASNLEAEADYRGIRESEVQMESQGTQQPLGEGGKGSTEVSSSKGVGKENIPPRGTELKSPKGKDTTRKVKGKGIVNREEVSFALIPYESPPPPKISDFLVEALKVRG